MLRCPYFLQFYAFLKQEDKDLLDFDLSGSDYDDESEDEEGPIHEIPDKLKVCVCCKKCWCQGQ